jgi:hypothetical protein
LSKAIAEFAAGAYRHSQFMRERPDVALITARAGNSVGGGDWAPYRLVPDAMRAFRAEQPLVGPIGRLSVRLRKRSRGIAASMTGTIWPTLLRARLQNMPRAKRRNPFDPFRWVRNSNSGEIESERPACRNPSPAAKARLATSTMRVYAFCGRVVNRVGSISCHASLLL